MDLPTSAQVNAATRHVATLAGGIIVGFGLANKIDPDTVNNIINATGTLINDGIVIVGLITPIVTAYYASHSARPDQQAKAALDAAKAGTLSPAGQAAVIDAATKVKQ